MNRVDGKKWVCLLPSLFFVCSVSSLGTFYDIKGWFDVDALTQSGIQLSFLSGTQVREEKLAKLKQTSEEFSINFDAKTEEYQQKIDTISSSLEALKSLREKSTGEQAKLVESRIEVLSARKLEMDSIRELLFKKKKLYESHINLLEKILAVIKERQKEGEEEQQKSYNSQHYHKFQAQVEEKAKSLKIKEKKQESLHKVLDAQRDRYVQMSKTLKSEEQEFDKQRSHEENLLSSRVALQQEKLNLLGDEKRGTQLSIEALKVEIEMMSDEIELMRFELRELEASLEDVKQNLVIGNVDITLAQEELKEVKSRVLKEKDELNAKREQIRKEKNQLIEELKAVTEEYKLIEEKKIKNAESYLFAAKRLRYEVLISEKESMIAKFEAEKEQGDAALRASEQQVVILEALFMLRQEKGQIEESYGNFSEQILTSHNKIKELRSRMPAQINNLDKIEAEEKKVSEAHHNTALFQTKNKTYQEILKIFAAVSLIEKERRKIAAEVRDTTINTIQAYEKIIKKSEKIRLDLESHRISRSIWKRSPKAISVQGFLQSLVDAERFGVRFFWETPSYLSPLSFFSSVRQLRLLDFFVLLFFILLFFILLFLVRKLLGLAQNILENYLRSGRPAMNLYVNVLRALIVFLIERSTLIVLWLYVFSLFFFRGRYLPLPLYYLTSPYFSTLFCLLSIPVFVYLAHHLLVMIKTLNQKLSFLFFTEKFQEKFIFLITISLYASAIAIPLRAAFLASAEGFSDFPAVILAAYSLILVVVLLFFFNKEDVLKLLPSQTPFFIWLKRKIERYYYPVFTFLMGLLILSNPYIGYSNLAWFLAFAMPSSALLIYGMFFFHNQLRKYAAFFFIREEEDQIIDKFEHAKIYYGFFIITTFSFMLGVTFLVVGRLWGFGYTLETLWQTLSERWVIHDVFIEGTKVGVVELITLILFVASGFFVSSILSKFVLNKLFDIFRTEPGTQNTISRILHYVIIFFAIIFGFTAIKMGAVVTAVSTLSLLGVGFGLKDLVSDFFAGFWVLIERPVEIGHFIETGEFRGTVQKIAVRATTIRTARNFSVIVPNRELVSKPIINWGGGRYAVGFEITLTVNYGTKTEVVVGMMREIIQKHPLVLRVPNVVIRLDDMTEDGLAFFARAFISSRRVRDQWDIASDIRLEIIAALAQKGIEAPHPVRVIYHTYERGDVTGVASDHTPEVDEITEQREQSGEGEKPVE